MNWLPVPVRACPYRHSSLRQHREMEMNLLNIRPACIEDLHFATTLVYTNMRQYYIDHGITWSDENFRRTWESSRGFIAIKANTRVGYLSITQEPDLLYLHDLHVVAGHCGQGIGSFMMRFIMDQLLTAPSRKMRLKVFRRNPAISFYERSGFCTVFSDERFLGMEYKPPENSVR